jgi:DNA-binding transcriptional MerR regulator
LNKAPDAFRTISEVADELDLPQHVLRFWESRFPHIRPMKRGGGRRYYRPEDIDLLRGIRHLLYGDGYTIRGVQRILREQGVRTVQSVGQGHVVNLPVQSRDDGREEEEPGGARGIFTYLPRFSGGPVEADDVDDAEAADEDRDDPPMELPRPVVAPQKRPNSEATSAKSSTGDRSTGDRSTGDKTAGANSAASVPTPGAAAALGQASGQASGQMSGQMSGQASGRAAQPLAFAPFPAKGLAAEDMDRLKHALGELEACRRLLDKASEGSR